jgi:hypothetical protein
LFAELAELRERAKVACERTQLLRQDHSFIVEAARAQSRSLIAASRRRNSTAIFLYGAWLVNVAKSPVTFVSPGTLDP